MSEQENKRSLKRDAARLPEPRMDVFIAGLYTQTLIALGDLDSPLTGKKEGDAAEAEYLIDTIAMLKEKTAGNLTPDEDAYMQSALADLRMRYVKLAEKPAAAAGEPPPECP